MSDVRGGLCYQAHVKVPTLLKFFSDLLSRRYLSQARRARRSGNLLKACDRYRQVIRLRPDAAATWIQLGHVQKQLGLHTDAASSYATALSLGSTDIHAREFVRTANALVEDGISRNSEEGLILQSSDSYRLRGDAANLAQQWIEARDAYAEYLKEHPENFAVLVQHGHMCKEAGDLRSAERSYVKALRIKPFDADLTLQMAHLMVRLGQAGRAIELYKEALMLNPALHDAQAILNWMQMQQTWR